MVARSSAILGLPGNIEEVIPLQGNHSDICRFDVEIPRDRENYRAVSFRLGKMRKAALDGALATTEMPGAGKNPT